MPSNAPREAEDDEAAAPARRVRREPAVPRVRLVDGSRYLYCPSCLESDLHVALKLHTIEQKDFPEGANKAELAQIPMEFTEGAQARFVCARCGYGEVYLRDHIEHREADEERRRTARNEADR